MASILLSHAAADRALVDELVDLLHLGSGVPAEEIFYSSGAGTGVPAGKRFNEHIRDQVHKAKIVIAVLTPRSLDSPFCLAEIGAAWVLEDNFFPLAVPDLDVSSLGGVLEGLHTRCLTDIEALAELHDRVCDALRLPISTANWDRRSRQFLGRIGPIHDELTAASAAELDVTTRLATRIRLRTQSGGDAFFTFDDPGVETFPQLVADADEIDVLSRTAVNILGHYERVFRRHFEHGGHGRLIMVDPQSVAARHLYGDNEEMFRRNQATAIAHVMRLGKYWEAGQLELRVCQASPPFSFVLAKRTPRSASTANIQLNMLYSRVGRDRPVVRLRGDDEWFDSFDEEFREIWLRAKDWSP